MKVNKKILSVVLGMTMTLFVGCSSTDDKKEDTTNNTQENQVSEENKDSEETEGNQTTEQDKEEPETIVVNSYDELVEVANVAAKELETVLSEAGLEYVISDNKFFVSSVDKTYEQYEKEYRQTFNYNIGNYPTHGEVDIYSYKEYHIDEELTADDEYVKAYHSMVEKYDETITMDIFLAKLNQMMSDSSSSEFKVGDIVIKAGTNENGNILSLNYIKSIEMAYEIDPIPVEYATMADFDAKIEKYTSEKGKTKYTDIALNEGSDLNPMLTIDYVVGEEDEFIEYINLDFTMAINNEDINSEDIKTKVSAFEITDEMKKELLKIDDYLPEVAGFSLFDYITVDQLADGVQVLLMRNHIDSNSNWATPHALPAPGFYDYGVELSDDIDNQEGSTALSIGININNVNVTAEGVTRR